MSLFQLFDSSVAQFDRMYICYKAVNYNIYRVGQ